VIQNCRSFERSSLFLTNRMSSEWTYYDANCANCGNKGELSMWEDDWNRWDYTLTGFKGRVLPTGPVSHAIECLKCGSFNVVFVERK
jgi:hypothetical protein